MWRVWGWTRVLGPGQGLVLLGIESGARVGKREGLALLWVCSCSETLGVPSCRETWFPALGRPLVVTSCITQVSPPAMLGFGSERGSALCS